MEEKLSDEERLERGKEALEYLIKLRERTEKTIQEMAYVMYALKYPNKKIPLKGYKRIIREDFGMVI